VSHERWSDSAAAYALDSLDAGERTLFEAHLSGCAECRHNVQEYRDVAGLLAHAAPDIAVPTNLGARVAQLVQADGTGRTKPSRARFNVTWLAIAAVLAIAATGAVIAYRMRLEANDLKSRIAALTKHATKTDSVLGYLAGHEVHVVSLAQAGQKPVMRVFWNHEQNRFIVTAFDLPPAKPGRTYQLWAVSKGKAPVSMGTFNTDAAGDATAVLAVSGEVKDLGFIDVCALTEEPAGGSPAPTETPQFVGEWRHTD
jgi:anti-sigma-K factor RskA